MNKTVRHAYHDRNSSATRARDGSIGSVGQSLHKKSNSAIFVADTYTLTGGGHTRDNSTAELSAKNLAAEPAIIRSQAGDTNMTLSKTGESITSKEMAGLKVKSLEQKIIAMKQKHIKMQFN